MPNIKKFSKEVTADDRPFYENYYSLLEGQVADYYYCQQLVVAKSGKGILLTFPDFIVFVWSKSIAATYIREYLEASIGSDLMPCLVLCTDVGTPTYTLGTDEDCEVLCCKKMNTYLFTQIGDLETPTKEKLSPIPPTDISVAKSRKRSQPGTPMSATNLS